MSLYQDRQIKGFLLFLTLFALLFVGTATVLTIYQVNDAEVLWLKHDEAVSSSLLEQGVPKTVRKQYAALFQSISAFRFLHHAMHCAIFSLCACHRNIYFFLEKEAIVSTGRQNIAKLHQRGLLLSFTAEL